MQRLAKAIQDQIDTLVNQYDARLQTMPGYERLPQAQRLDLERQIINLIVKSLLNGDSQALVQYVQQRATYWAATGLEIAWFQAALIVPEEILVPLIDSAEASNFLWQALNRCQAAVWQLAADRLHQSEDRFRRFSEVTDNGLVFHEDGKITDANAALVAMFGYSDVSELQGKVLQAFIAPEDRAAVWQQMQSENAQPFEALALRKDGTVFPVEALARIYDYQGHTVRVASLHDITGRKRAEQETNSAFQMQQLLNTLLNLSLEDLPLAEQLERALDTIVTSPFLPIKPQSAIFLAEQNNVLTLKVNRHLAPQLLSLCALVPFGRCLCGRAAATGQIQFADCVDERHENQFDGMRPHGHYNVPIVSRGKLLGVMVLYVEEGHRPDKREQDYLWAVANTLASIIERKRLEQHIQDSLEQRSRQVQTSVEVTQYIAAAPELEELFHRVVTLIKERFSYYHAQLFRYEPAQDAVVLITGYGEIGLKMQTAGHKLAMGHGVVGTAAAMGQSILAADVARDPDWRPNPNLPNTKGELAVPIKLGSGDAESQLNALKHFGNGNYDGLAVAAIDPEAAARLTHAALRHGKPVVAISNDLGQDNQSALVAPVEHELGYLLGVQAGTWAKQHLSGSQNVKLGLLTYSPPPNVTERESGIIDGIQSILGERVTVVASGSAIEPKEATYWTERWLHDHPDLNMIVAYNDATALGAYQAALGLGWRDPDQFFIGGIDAVPEALAAIQQGGVYQATVNLPPEIMGVMAVRTLMAAIKGLPVKPVYTLYCTPVNRSNAAQFAGPFREAAVLADQDIISAEALSGLDVSGLRLGLSVMTLANPFFATLAESAQKEAQRLGVQLVVNDPSHVLGVLDVQSDQANTLTDDDRLLLEGLCGQIAIAIKSKQTEIERERLIAEQKRSALQLQTAAEVSRATSSILNLNDLLPQAAELIRERFKLYYVGIFLNDEADQWAVLRAGTGDAGQYMLATGHRLKIGAASMISQCIVNQQARIALDVGTEAVRFDNPRLPLTRSELALPLISRGHVTGAVTIQSDQPAAFTSDDIIVLQTMADQISNAIENARLFEQSNAALREVDALNRRLTGEGWEAYLHRGSSQQVIWAGDDETRAPAALTVADEQLSDGQIVIESLSGDEQQSTVSVPVMMRGLTIGAIRLRVVTENWSADTATTLTSIAGHIAQSVENARLLDQTGRTAQREKDIALAADRIHRSGDLEEVLRTTLAEVSRITGLKEIGIQIGRENDRAITQ